MSAFAAVATGTNRPDRRAGARPPAPRSVADSGLNHSQLIELIGKVLFLQGRMRLGDLADYLCLRPSVLTEPLTFMRSERMVEIHRGGLTENDNEYQLTDSGRDRAVEAMQRCQYAGPAPVTLEDYCRIVMAQSLEHQTFDAANVRDAFRSIVLDPDVVDQIGSAMNSGRAILLYGPAGSGKTFLAEHLSSLLEGAILVPHAITVGGEIIQVFDPLVHTLAERAEAAGSSVIRADSDERWVVCKRPFVLTGGELTLSMLDLQFDPATRFYQAPPHMKANGGMFVVDDLGRQLVAPRDLMNRWIVPLDRRRDYLALHSGFKFVVPFDMTVVFSTNLRPDQLADEAFLRRFGYKIHLGPMDLPSYRQVFTDACVDLEVDFDPQAFDWLIHERHRKTRRPLLACYPRDLIGRVRDFAIYSGEPAAIDPVSLSRAWSTYFVSTDETEPIGAGPADAPV
ncbi:MAG: AAA family ATPase [Burkholderiales bacterium]|nr:MAG: AAA family ATPase [Burkholderiales bacterium]